MHSTENYIKLISDALQNRSYGDHPVELYEPISYIMELGGKRMRPMLVLLAYGLFRDDPEVIVEQALAVEVFHNFTLMHDDIMDRAPLRRGKPSVHARWNDSTAILSGDVMLIRAYDLLLKAQPEVLKEALDAFNKCAAEVCEGQQLDMLFEERETVTEEEYIEMIRLKTAVLLGFSLELGAILAGAPEQDREELRLFGTLAGVGFQLQDDYLDVFADQNKFGKQVGGDIIANKKTYLMIKSLEAASGKVKDSLNNWLSADDFDPAEKVQAVTEIYRELGIDTQAQEKMDAYFEDALVHLRRVNAPLPRISTLKNFAVKLIKRDY